MGLAAHWYFRPRPTIHKRDFVTISDGSNILHISVGNNLSLTSVGITSNGTTVTDSAPTGSLLVTGQALWYDFVDASTVLNGKPEAITGFFLFDPSTHIEYGAELQFTGPAPYAGMYGFDEEYLVSNCVN